MSKSFAFLSIFFFAFGVNAAQLNVISDNNFPSGAVYSNNTASYGIQTTTNNASNPWFINTGGDIVLDNNRNALNVSSNGKLKIENSGTNTIWIKSTGSFQGISVIGSASAYLEIKNMSINIENITDNSSNAKRGAFFIGDGAVARVYSDADRINKLISNNGLSNGLNISSNGSLYITNMDVDVSGNANGIALRNQILGSVLTEIIGKDDGSNKLTINNNTSYGVFVGNLSTINIKDMDVEVIGNNTGISTYVNDSIGTGNGIINISADSSLNKNLIVQNNDEGMFSYSSQSTKYGIINISDMNVSILDNDTNGITAYDRGIINIQSIGTAKNLLLKNNGVASINLAYSDGEVNIDNMKISNIGNIFVVNDGGGTLNIDNSTLYSDSLLLSSSSSFVDAGIVNFTNVITNNTSNLLVDVSNNNNITFNADNSVFNGSSSTASGSTFDVNLTNNSSWSINSSSTVSNLTNSDSKIDLRADSGFNTLNVTSYDASNGKAYINTLFGSSSVTTDKLIISGGDATGNTTFYVNSLGDGGSLVDVMVADLTGATTKSAVFTLDGGVVDSGAYEYELSQFSDENWYLHSNGIATNTAKTIANIPAIHLHIIKTGMNELRKRLGELRDNSPENKSGVWARSYAKHLNVDDTIDSHMNLYGIEGGFDHKIYNDCDNKVYAGFMMGYAYTDNIKTRQHNGRFGEADANTPSIGAYVSWLNSDGWFTDFTVRHFWSDMNVSTFSSNGGTIAYDPDRNFIATSLELGRQLEFGINDYSKWIVEPKAEVGYAFSKAKNFKTTNNNKVHYDDTQSLYGSIGVMLGYNYELENGMIMKPFVEVRGINEFDGKTDIVYVGQPFKSDISGASVEFSAGLNANLSNNWNFYSDIAYENGDIIRAVSTNIGLRYEF